MRRYVWNAVIIDDLITNSTDITLDDSVTGQIVGKRKELIAIKCDLCDFYSVNDDGMVNQEFVTIDGRFGWPSIYDGALYEMDICHECVVKFGRIKVK